MPHTRHIALLAASALVWTAAGCATARCPADGGRPWRELTSARFRVITDLDPEQARQAVATLERVNHLLVEVLKPPVPPQGRLRVIAFDEARIFDFRKANEWSSATFHHGGPPKIVLTSYEDRELAERKRPEILAHEYTHYLVRALLHSPPLWLNEGLAVLSEGLRIAPDGSTATLGYQQPGFLSVLRERGLLPMKALWTWGNPYWPPDDSVARFYASAWFWTAQLVTRDPERFDQFLSRLAAGEKPRAAWDAVFPPDEVAERYRLAVQALKGGRTAVRVRQVKLPPDLAVGAEERLLSPAEFHVLVAELARDGNIDITPEESLVREKAELARALEHDPLALAPNLALLARAGSPAAPGPDRLSLARRVATAHPESAAAWAALARVLEDSGQAQQAEIDEAKARQARLAPDDPTYDAVLTAAYLRRPQEAERMSRELAAGHAGTLPTWLVRQSLQGSTRIPRCYARSLKAGSGAPRGGQLTVRFTVTPLGDVEGEEVLPGATVEDEALVKCVLAAVRHARFPWPVGGPVTATYPVRFDASGGAGQLVDPQGEGAWIPAAKRQDRRRVAPSPVAGVAATYPEAAAAAGLDGTVVLRLRVDADGAVAEARVVTGAGHGFDEAALEAARQLRFSPAMVDGQPVEQEISFTFAFQSGAPAAGGSREAGR